VAASRRTYIVVTKPILGVLDMTSMSTACTPNEQSIHGLMTQKTKADMCAASLAFTTGVRLVACCVKRFPALWA